jgi:molecular chaperone HtpG
LRGVVDSEDIPLNISRETMQDTSLIQKLNKVITSRFIKFLEEQATKDPAQYEKFFKEFGRFIKEGVIVDFTHREALAKLLRYESSTLPKGQHTSLTEYVQRMPADQKEIYFHLAPNREAAEASPYFEVFSARKYEVLFFYDNWDEFAMDHLHSFDGKNIKAAERADLALDTSEKADGGLSTEAAEDLAKWIKEVLKEAVSSVRSSKRLVDSPAVVVDQEQAMTRSMRHILRQMSKEGTPAPEHKFDLEINPRHPVIVQLDQIRSQNTDLAAKVAEQIFDNARVAAGVLEDPRAMLKRMNELLQTVLEAKK